MIERRPITACLSVSVHGRRCRQSSNDSVAAARRRHATSGVGNQRRT